MLLFLALLALPLFSVQAHSFTFSSQHYIANPAKHHGKHKEIEITFSGGFAWKKQHSLNHGRGRQKHVVVQNELCLECDFDFDWDWDWDWDWDDWGWDDEDFDFDFDWDWDCPPEPTPIPSTGILALFGIGGIILLRRIKR